MSGGNLRGLRSPSDQYAARYPEFYWILFRLLVVRCIFDKDDGPDFHTPAWSKPEADRLLSLLAEAETALDAGVIAPVDIAAIDEDVESRKFPFKHLPKFYAKTGGQNKSFAIDHRDLVFAKAHVGQDGGLHDIPADAEEDLTAARLRRELESRFRFGTPLQPPGFQHDVQREFGAPLVRERMFCIDRGPVNVFGDHANVFGSDMITAHRIEDAQNE